MSQSGRFYTEVGQVASKLADNLYKWPIRRKWSIWQKMADIGPKIGSKFSAKSIGHFSILQLSALFHSLKTHRPNIRYFRKKWLNINQTVYFDGHFWQYSDNEVDHTWWTFGWFFSEKLCNFFSEFDPQKGAVKWLFVFQHESFNDFLVVDINLCQIAIDWSWKHYWICQHCQQSNQWIKKIWKYHMMYCKGILKMGM